MSGSDSSAGRVLASATTVAGTAAVLPFTGHHSIAVYVAATAIVCALAVIVSKLIKRVLVRH